MEWPPSPWRILRALVATWKRKLDDDPVCNFENVSCLLKKLSSPPLFILPQASTGHTRHFMPKNADVRTLVFDAFVTLDKKDEIIALWPDESLAVVEKEALEKIAFAFSCLGRAESWVVAGVLDDSAVQSAYGNINCYPLSVQETVFHAKDRMDVVRVLCADPETAFMHDHTPKLIKKEGKGKAKCEITSPLYDPDWNLCLETLELHKERWSDPPGSKWISYLRPKDCFKTESRRPKIVRSRLHPTVARFAIDGTVLPLVEETLKIAELARRTTMGVYRRIEEQRLYGGSTPAGQSLPRSSVFSGKDQNGQPLDGHRHAFFIPTDEDGDGRIDHLTIMAEMGFDPQEVKALDKMRRLKRDDGEPMNLVLLAIGQKEAIHSPKTFGPSKVWISATPFIATRHTKARGKKKDPPELLGIDNQRAFAKQVLIEEINRLRNLRSEISEPISVDYLNDEHRMGAHKLRPIQYKRFRQKRTDDGGRRSAGAYRIVFSDPVVGPICLGHSSHFGMGLFIPED
jgi:CRISPR-associated protein Csb2